MKGTRFVVALIAVGLGLNLTVSAQRQIQDEAAGFKKKAASSNFVRSSYGLGSRGLPGFEAKRHNYTKREDFREVQGYEKREGIGESQSFARKDNTYKDAQSNAKRDGRTYG